MRHGKKLKKLNRDSSHRKALLMNLAVSLFKHERIKTTLAKAKAVKPIAEKIITKARNSKGLSTLRGLYALTRQKEVVDKLLGDLSNRFKTRPGGYTRIYKCGFRSGDDAPVAMLELVDYNLTPKKQNTTKKGADNSKTVKDK